MMYVQLLFGSLLGSYLPGNILNPSFADSVDIALEMPIVDLSAEDHRVSGCLG